MDNLKKIGKAMFFPHILVVFALFILAMGFLLFSMMYFGTEHIVSYISYVISFYALVVLCVRIPQIIKLFKKIKNENKYVLKYRQDPNLRIKLSLYGTFFINITYSIFQLCLGIYHKSFWFYSMAIYYALFSIVRFYLLNFAKKNKLGVDILGEYKRYNFCGWVMLLMNIAVTIIIFFIIYFGKTFYHHEITTIALAAYTFLSFGLSIFSFIKYRKYNSPMYSAAKSLNLVSGCVSMMTLTTTMLTTFGSDEIFEFKKILLTIVGIVVSLFILAIFIQIIVATNKKIKNRA